uniref:Large ribosomal subunit protein uL22 n=1 Tax=uncultured Chloroflexi bacterium Rifle_16ft_4_minimus_14836 TaxID=1665059 RepID=A0A0H4T0U7_9CHLR|nr:50S ribosomal protein L22, large subunit ribosomal protein L22 [uncultured Chloroflexi bacterium Rifle_16ft_4_minimus_14836]
MKKIDAITRSGQRAVIRTWSRASTILPQMVGLTIGVHDGRRHVPIFITSDGTGDESGAAEAAVGAMDVRAQARNLGFSASKVRPLLALIKEKPAAEALAILRYAAQPSARQVAKALRSALANAENNYQLTPARLRVTAVYADEGPTLKRFRASPRGRVRPIRKRTSHLTVVVGEG